MKNLYKLIDAICETYDDETLKPFDHLTFCNIAVDIISGKMGYDKFAGLLANEMIDLIEKSEEWVKIEMKESQFFANQGYLVIACRRNEPNGHIVVIRPGVVTYSQKFTSSYVPKCIQIGRNCYLSRGVNWAFKELPDFYVLVK